VRAWHLIYNLDGSFRGYEGALDENGNPRPSLVYAQEGRNADGSLVKPQLDEVDDADKGHDENPAR
jgi:hypothetical protein